MNKEVDFYKEFYFKEIDRKNELENKVNLPVLIISIIISIHLYVFEQSLPENFLIIIKIISGITISFVVTSIYFLLKSYSDFYKSHWYKEIASMDEIKKYHDQLQNNYFEEGEIKFTEYLKKEFADCTAVNFRINKKRTVCLARCKQFLFISIFFTALLSIVYTIILLKFT